MTQETKDIQVRTNGEVQTERRPVLSPAADVRRTSRGYVLTMDVPGVDPDSIDLTYSSDVLRVKGRTQSSKQDSRGQGYAEFELGDYERAFEFAEPIQADAIEAKITDGVLEVMLPLVKPAETKISVHTN